jgi:hypothetical protein
VQRERRCEAQGKPEALVDRDIDEGRRLIQALDQAGFPLVAALWRFLALEGVWRRLIASPKVREAGPRAAYAAIQDVLRQSPIGLPLHRISAVGPDEPMVTELRIFAGTDPAPFIGSTYLQKAVIGDTYVEGAYIYRAQRILGQSGTFELWSVAPDSTGKAWVARRCKVTVEDGFFKKIEVEGLNWPQTHARAGVNAHLGVLTNVEERAGEAFGDIQRWTILGGRLRSVDTVARGVRVEGLSAAPSSAGAGEN